MAEAEPRGNVDYFRKLHQQIVQKDNIIKLLQLELRELQAGSGDPDAMARLEGALGEAEDRLAEYESREDDEAATERRLLELEGELDDLRGSAEEAARLTAELSLAREELARYKELLESAEEETGAVERMRRQEQEDRKELDALRVELGRLREDHARGGDPDEAAAENARLAERVQDLEAALEIARDTVERLEVAAARPRGPAREGGEVAPDLAEGVIEALQLIEDHERSLYTAEEAVETLGEALRGVAAGMGLERIACVGEDFDPDTHVAGRITYSEDAPHGAVVAEEVAGYRLGERVVKLAQVTVCRNPWFCERCQIVGVAGAAFCHGCGGRIEARKAAREGEGQKRRPRDEARHLLDVARSLARKGDARGAREKIAKAGEIAPDDPWVAVEAALVDEEEGRFREAHDRLRGLPPEVPGMKDLARHRERLASKVEIMERLRTVR